MTNTLEGRTYSTYSWLRRYQADDLLDDLSVVVMDNGNSFRDDELVQIRKELVVPNGKWVMERPRYGYAWLVGASHDEVGKVVLKDEYNHSTVLCVCDKPFGFIAAEPEDVDTSVYPRVIKPTGRKTLVYAQQIHKGELGQSVPIPRVDYVRQPFEPGTKPNVTKARERRRGYGWVKLAHLGEMTVGYNPDRWVALVLGYWQFSGHLRYEDHQRVGTLVDTVWGSELDIQVGDVDVVSMTMEQFRRDAEHDSSELWIRRGFAYTILRLLALGVEPEVLQSA